MKARVKFYSSIFDACDDKDGCLVTIYGDNRHALMQSIYSLTDKYVVSNVFIDESEKKEQNT